MPTSTERARGGVERYRTIRVGRGKNMKYMHIAIVPKAGKRGGHTVGGKEHSYKKRSR